MGSRTIAIAALLAASCGVALHVRSYWRSDSLTLCDVTLATDEGLVSLQVPLTRLAANESPISEAKIYTRGPTSWTLGQGGKCTLRVWMSSLEAARCEGAMFAGFGYWLGGWQDDARPGPFIVMFTPVWFVALAAFGLFLAFHYRWIRFTMRTLLVVTTIGAGLMWLLTLRAPQ